MSETIPFHRDYQILCPKERIFYKKVRLVLWYSHTMIAWFRWWNTLILLLHVMLLQKLLAVLDELEILKPKVRRQLDELEKAHTATQMHQFDGPNKITYASSLNNKSSLIYVNKQVLTKMTICLSLLFEVQYFWWYEWNRNNGHFQHVHFFFLHFQIFGSS